MQRIQETYDINNAAMDMYFLQQVVTLTGSGQSYPSQQKVPSLRFRYIDRYIITHTQQRDFVT